MYEPEDTLILCVVAPLLHRYELPDEDVRVTVPPHWITVPAGEIVGVDAVPLLTVPDAVEVHPLELVTVTVYVPAPTETDCEVAPVLHT